MSKGTVTFWNAERNFGKIESDDHKGKKFHFHRADLRGPERDKIGQGSEVEFEVIDPEPQQGPRAKEVKVVTEGKKDKVAVKGHEASLHFGEAIRSDQLFELEVVVRVSDLEGKPIYGAKVRLNCGSQPVTHPAEVQTTRKNGTARFLLQYAKTADWSPESVRRLTFAATVKVGDTEETFGDVWPQADIPLPSADEPKGSPAKAEVVRLKSDAHSPINAPYRAVIPVEALNEKGKAAEITLKAKVIKGKKLKFLNANDSSVLAQDAMSCEFTTGPDGKFRLGVNFSGQLDVEVEISYPDAKASLKFLLQYD
jgi:cold shock CspA family protein